MRPVPGKYPELRIGFAIEAFFQQFDGLHWHHWRQKHMENQDQISTLNTLIETTIDSITG